jgi:hypothetical protein
MQAVLDARTQFAASSLADLYDLTMPPACSRRTSGWTPPWTRPISSPAAPGLRRRRARGFLFTLYQRITSLLPAVPISLWQKSCGITGSIYNFQFVSIEAS